jgi:hypothetical protein
MKVFTFYYNRYDDATTSKALYDNGIDHNVLIHTREDYEKFVKGNTIYGQPIITNSPKGLSWQRNKALDMMEEDEWAVFMCDDFRYILSYSKEFIFSKTIKHPVKMSNQNAYSVRRKDSENIKRMSLQEAFTLFPKLIQVAEKNNIHLIGFGLHDSPLNLGNKFSHKGLADGRFWLVKKSSYRFDTNVQLIDDVQWTAENLVRHNNVLILNWLVPYFRRYSKGGFGSTEERKEQRKKECLYLVNKYNPLIKFAEKPGWEYGTHIRLTASDGNITKARKRIYK